MQYIAMKNYAIINNILISLFSWMKKTSQHCECLFFERLVMHIAQQTISSHTAVNVHCIINYSTFCTLCCSRKKPYLPNGKFLLSRELGRETCLKMSRRGKASRCMFVQGVTVHFIKSHCC